MNLDYPFNYTRNIPFNNIFEYINWSNEIFYEIFGKKPTKIMMPKFRNSEFEDALRQLGVTTIYDAFAIDSDFEIFGIKGWWWNKSYIELS